MSHPRPRPLASVPFLAVIVLLSSVTPSLATDPPAGGAPEAPPMPPSVHAEMLEEHAATSIGFAPGDVPAALAAPEPGGGTMSLEGGTGGIAALPNGLSHEVFGYLPWWMLGASDLANLRYDLVSTIAYFGVPARSTGSLGLTTKEGSGWTSSAMTSVISKAHARGVRVVLTVTMMAWDADYTDMRALLSSPSRRATLVGNIAATVKARNADGVNVDFEPVPSDQKANFTAFVRELKAGLKAAGAGSYVTVATMAGAASWATGYDVVGLTASGAADALMVMAYDFHYAASARAGGVAPYESPHIFAARAALRDYLAKVPESKIIWGVPYYGREWSTVSGDLNARTNTVLTSEAGHYTFHRREAAEHGRLWDSTGRVPWYRYRSSSPSTWVQGYYDDPTSLKHKYGLVKGNGLRGVGVWHLLMDGTRDDLWDLLYTQFGPLPFTDIRDSKFALDIVWLADEAITSGCTATAFCPKGGVTRSQMASFLARFLDLPATSTDYFDDDDANKHESNINRLAAAGITYGCGQRRYCPDGLVLRDQMASFLSRALKLPATSTDHYDDDEGNRHEDAINRFAEANVTHGCGAERYCPKGTVLREQMAAFLHRASRR
jgi:spore germination protein YaaH